MKKCISFYLCFLILLFPLSLKAMEGPAQEADKLALEKLRALVATALPEIRYDIQRDRDGDAEVLGAADVHVQEVLPITIWLDNIFSRLIEKRDFNKDDFHSLVLTCKFFNLLTKAAVFSLNEYCQTESRPHAIPHGLLQIKTRNSKDGIIKLAELLSVTSTDLSQWFGPDLLNRSFSHR